jgi:hypothetical protein
MIDGRDDAGTRAGIIFLRKKKTKGISGAKRETRINVYKFSGGSAYQTMVDDLDVMDLILM